jgi:hypothetical protein
MPDFQAAAARFKEAQHACDTDPTETNKAEATRTLAEWGAALASLTQDGTSMQLHINALLKP